MFPTKARSSPSFQISFSGPPSTSSFQTSSPFGFSSRPTSRTEDAVEPQRPSSTMSSSSNKMSLKLLIDATAGRVLFAEASKDFIDFLFNLLRFPIGTVTRALTENGMVGSVGKIYKSIENLSDDYFLNPQKDKNRLLKSGSPASIDGGFVKGSGTYMVMDDLEVQPMSTISCFTFLTLLNKFNIKDISALHEKVVELGTEERIKLLKASLQSNHVLTSAFLNNVRD